MSESLCFGARDILGVAFESSHSDTSKESSKDGSFGFYVRLSVSNFAFIETMFLIFMAVFDMMISTEKHIIRS